MKKILIVIHDMKIGGAQKSLLSFLKGLAAWDQKGEYEVHLLVSQPMGAFFGDIPDRVKILQPSPELYWLSASMNMDLLWEHFSLRGILGELCWIWNRKRSRFPARWSKGQQLWASWRSWIPAPEEEYDAAISYIDGYPNYFVMEKVKAKKKVLWFHSEYQKHGYDPAFDAPYLAACDAVVTISEKCRDCLLQAFPEHGGKIHVLENITLRQEVLENSRKAPATEFAACSGWKLLTVGRLHPLKGIDLALEAAKHLADRGENFLWLVIGEGSERPALERRIEELGISRCFRLLGAKENPYPYMAACDILVQPSRVEGKSIVLDETKLLKKPIVATAYATVGDAIDHGVTGWVVDMNGQALCDGILRLIQDEDLRRRLAGEGCSLPGKEEEQVRRYVQIMFP